MKENNHQNNHKDNSKEPETVLRKTTISFRVTHAERTIIGNLADKCDMKISDYVRCRAINYEPKARLTPEQTELRNELVGIRSDYVKYNSMLKGMSQEERTAMFRRNDWMLTALKKLGVAVDLITKILRENFAPNPTPKITVTCNKPPKKA